MKEVKLINSVSAEIDNQLDAINDVFMKLKYLERLLRQNPALGYIKCTLIDDVKGYTFNDLIYDIRDKIKGIRRINKDIHYELNMY